ncbi:NAD kinase [Mucilaginibacter ginkgonis]|uniref:NAD kinase n=1 Tax=Mucilaginibacter ginkgonis TaxID=2682091 RepID=A0A6I4I5L0_9SPHI|nr:NAD kinase [Mucilaginibacter ginkgonis]QQL48481.1 NAD kinase [Mucilaginibacter ginkgonis]
MKIAVYGRQFNDMALPYAQKVFEVLAETDVEVYVPQDFHDFLSQKLPNFKYAILDKDKRLKGYIDMFFTLGGDGTLLDTVSVIKDSGIPVLGINFGRLGFLAVVNKGEIEGAIKSVLKGEYSIDSRTLMCISSENDVFKDHNVALNDITFHKRDDSAMITMHAYLNGEFLNTYWGDGIIISTSTGSTAYSLSCGGPIIFPQSDTIVITPVSPHNLNVRPIVLPDSCTLSFEVETRSANYLISCDSHTAVIDKNMKFEITKATYDFNLVRLNNETYLNTLRTKLLWGLDARNY